VSFLVADAVSLGLRLALARFSSRSGFDFDHELRYAALDALWCTVAVALAELPERSQSLQSTSDDN